MKKNILLFAAIMMASTRLWANDITFTATNEFINKLPQSENFDVAIATIAYVEDKGIGTITFSGDVTKIGTAAFANCIGLTSITLPNTVTTIGNEAFAGCSSLASMVIPNTVTTIGDKAFAGCSSLQSVIFEGTACQNAIGVDAFAEVGTSAAPATLTVPNDWSYAAAPDGESSTWHGGYFSSNLYSTEGATDKQAAIDAITCIVAGYGVSAYLQSLLEEEIGKINGAVNRPEVNERKQAAIDKMTLAVASYAKGVSEGQEDDTMGPVQPGITVEVIDQNGKVWKFYNPKKVNFIKVEMKQ